jgi:hypothetical protein
MKEKLLDLLRDYRNYFADYLDPQCTDQEFARQEMNRVQAEIIAMFAALTEKG